MKIAVRYFSKFGRTERIAKGIARGISVIAKSITEEKELNEKYDLLFLGGAPYANIMDSELRKYVKNLTTDKVKNVVLFTTSNWSRRTIYAMGKILQDKGIKVEKETFYAHMLQIDKREKDAEDFSKHIIEKYK